MRLFWAKKILNRILSSIIMSENNRTLNEKYAGSRK